jgi:aminoglycoside phosphotransferase (APT) family kinase protein
VREWSAEIDFDGDLARRLIAGQFPEVELGAMRVLGEGWDNVVWLADERWAFRFPRRAIAIPGVERELAVLPGLAPRLPVPVPSPVFAGRPALGYPWPFFGAELLPGVESADAALTDAARRRLAAELGAFLRVLHGMEVDGDLPLDPNGRADMARRASMAEDWIGRLEHAGRWRAPAAVARVLDSARRLPPEPAVAVVAHGDLHFRHLLVDRDGALTGVIDWGDVCRGDPSIDLSLLWSFFPPEARDAFLAAYGLVSDEQLLRARALALCLCAILAFYGHQEGMPNVEREAVEGLERTLA